MGPADLDDGGEFRGLAGERGVQAAQRREKQAMDLLDGGDMHGGRETVIRGLPEIDVVVGVDRLLAADDAAETLDGQVGDDLVGVHVGLGARAGLPHDEREIVETLERGDLGGGGGDGRAELGVELTELHIGEGGRLLDQAESADERRRHELAADAEILQRALRLGPQ